MDVVSDAIETMRIGRPASSRLSVGPPWRFRFAPYEGAGFHVLLRGSGWLVPDEGEPVPLSVGDAVLVPHGASHVLADSPTAEGAVPFEVAVPAADGPVEFLCGKYRLDRSRAHPLLTGMPDLVHLPADLGRHARLRAAIDLLGGEVRGGGPGRETVITSLLDLLLVYMLRAWLEDDAGGGWPGALRDPEIAAALEALHSRPAAPWRIEDLAAHVGLSRATLARRFTALTGRPPMAYLTWWRMTTAARLLHESDLPLLTIARQVGYGSPYAFSHAFKRQFGVPPGAYREREPVRLAG